MFTDSERVEKIIYRDKANQAYLEEAKEYVMTADYHTHTTFSHGNGSAEDNIKAAISRGLREIAISDHGPGHKFYGVDLNKYSLDAFGFQLEELRQKYPEIKIHWSVEANIVDNGRNNLDIEEGVDFDFLNAGYHYGIPKAKCISNFIYAHGFKIKALGEKLKAFNTEMTIKALEKNKIKILTHPGDKGPFDILELAKCCAKMGTWMEISSRHSHLTVDEIKIAMTVPDVKFVVSSDAHRPENVGDYLGGVAKALEAGLDMNRIVNIKKR
ncbi:MAG: PHP domain-containing protein [Clostridia bacterium]|nr:PHP domain-containing protein [Clostridia bacterium]